MNTLALENIHNTAVTENKPMPMSNRVKLNINGWYAELLMG